MPLVSAPGKWTASPKPKAGLSPANQARSAAGYA